MSKTLFAIIALSACALLACNKQETEISNDPTETVEMTVVAGNAATKTAFSGTSIIWSGTEKLKVIEAVTGGTDDGKFSYNDSSAGVSTDDGETMTFNVSLSSHTGATSFQYVALYPHSSFNKVTNLTNIAVNTLSEQNPTASSFDPAADFLISEVSASSASQPTSINMAFARKIAIGEMTIKNLDSSDDITSVTFSAQKKSGELYNNVLIAGRSKVDFTASSVNYGSNLQNYSISMDYAGDNVKANTESGAKTYFTCYPFSLAADDKFTVVVETNTHRFTRTVTLTGAQTLEFTPGDVSQFSVNMSGVTGEAKAISLHYAEFTKEDVYGYGITNNTYAAIDLDKTHGDKWIGFVNYANSGFGLRGTTSAKNDSYIKLPDFAEEISTITVYLSQPLSATDGEKYSYLFLVDASNKYSGFIEYLEAAGSATTYVFDVASDNITTAYLRSLNFGAYVTKVAVVTKKTEDRTSLSAPETATASLSGTNAIKVDWDTVTGAVGYTVEYTNVTADPDVVNTVYVAGQATSTTTISGLPNTTEYAIRVCAVADAYLNFDSSYTAVASNVTTGSGVTYSKYNGALAAGDYIIVGQSNDVAMKNVISGTRIGYESITITDGVITNPSAAFVWHISQSGDYWLIHNSTADKYAAGTGTKNQGTLSDDDDADNSLWSVAASGTTPNVMYTFTNKGHTEASINAQLNYNSGYGFACYASGKVRLYKKD